MAAYRFVTFWQVDAPIDAVWDAIVQAERWPEWWKGVTRVVQLDPGGEDGLGARNRYTFRSRLPYNLTFETRSTVAERPHHLLADASGELVGTGRWRLAEREGGTLVRYDWDISTTRPWMNAIAPLARPLFEINHHAIMRWGGQGLARLLGARVRYARGTPDVGPLATPTASGTGAGSPTTASGTPSG